MATMIVRTTVAFDPATAQRLDRLSKRWKVSKSEALRRALESAEAADNRQITASDEVPDFTCMTPLKIVQWLKEHPSPPVPGGWGANPHEEMRRIREMDAAIEEERSQRYATEVAETGSHYES